MNITHFKLHIIQKTLLPKKISKRVNTRLNNNKNAYYSKGQVMSQLTSIDVN